MRAHLMDWLNKAELKFGKIAIPGIVRVVAGFQLLVFVLFFVNESLYEALTLEPDRILAGEVWRLFTYIFIPRVISFWIIIQVIFLFMINDGLEHAWGPFKLNAYLFSTMFCLAIGSFLLWRLGLLYTNEATMRAGELTYYSLFLAFSVLYPDRIIHFMLILPIKIKWLAFLLAGYILLDTLRNPVYGVLVTFTLLPFVIFALPPAIDALRHRLRVAERRQDYRQKSMPLDESFHRCAACGKTEHDDPHLEFRVTADDGEYCVPCLDARKEKV